MRRPGGAQPGAGRPPGAEARRAEETRIRLSEAELAELVGAAGGEPLSTWLRELALAVVREPDGTFLRRWQRDRATR